MIFREVLSGYLITAVGICALDFTAQKKTIPFIRVVL